MDKFNIYSARRKENKITNEMYAGYALSTNEGYYKVRLSIFPMITYFMRKNKDPNKYTLFSQMRKKGGEARFLNPVGHAVIDDNLKAHVTLRFDVLRATLYMSLFPEGMCV